MLTCEEGVLKIKLLCSLIFLGAIDHFSVNDCMTSMARGRLLTVALNLQQCEFSLAKIILRTPS